MRKESTKDGYRELVSSWIRSVWNENARLENSNCMLISLTVFTLSSIFSKVFRVFLYFKEIEIKHDKILSSFS